MKWTRLSLLTLLLAAFVLALPVAAQDTATDLQTFTTEDGRASVQFPASWVFEEGFDSDSILTLKVANTPDALEKELFIPEDAFESGEVHIEVAAIALAELASDISDNLITTTSTPADILDALTSQGMPDEFDFGDSGEITVNGIPAVRVNLVAEERGEGQLLLTVIDQQWVVAIILYAAPGEGDKWDIIARDILGSVTINDETAEEMLTYTSHVGGFTVSYPYSWEFDDRSDDTSDDVIGGVFSSNDSAQYKHLYSDVFESGDFVVELSIADLAKLQTLPELADATADITAVEVAQALVDAKVISEDVEYGDVESVSFNLMDAAQADLAYEENGEGRMLLVKRDDGKFVFAAYYSAVGELQSAETFAYTILASLDINDPKPDETPEPDVTAEPVQLTNSASNDNGMLMYPSTWFTRESGSDATYIANTEAALDKSFGDSLASGEANMLLGFDTIANYIDSAKLPLTPDATAVELLEMTTVAVDESVTFTSVEETTIAGKPAARVDFSTPTFEGTAWLITYDDERLITIQLLAAPGEAERWQQIALDIMATAAFTSE